jgi:hypothetical protein
VVELFNPSNKSTGNGSFSAFNHHNERYASMKRLAVLFFVCSFVFAGSALACHFDGFTPTANCVGWSVSGSINLDGADYADLTYTVTLSDGSGTVAQFTGSERIYDSSPTFNYGNPWGMELCGDYTAYGSFTFTSAGGGDKETFLISFTCICEPPDGCTGTPGYWKNHPDEWPVGGLTVGGAYYTKAQLMVIFDEKTGGDATIKLFHHTVAAMLNVLHGADNSIQPTIDAANAFLTAHPLYSKPTGEFKTEANSLKDALVAYNESQPCGDVIIIPLVSKSLPLTPAPATETKTWGSIKKMYE